MSRRFHESRAVCASPLFVRAARLVRVLSRTLFPRVALVVVVSHVLVEQLIIGLFEG
jgi:hypothetical protein